MASGPIDAKDSRWYLNVDQLQNSPSRKSGIDADQELNHRQKAAYLIQDMGQRLRVSQLCINTAIVYMHRFYAYHSFTYFHRNGIATASLFLAAKVEEQPRKLENIIKVVNGALDLPDPSKEGYHEQAQDLVFNENVLLQTLGFDVAVDHPHTHVVKTCQLVKACKDLAQTSYFLATNSLHLTTMCLQYRPTVVACFCIYLGCKWSGWEIPQSTEGKSWFHYVDKNVNVDLLEQLTREFLVIYERSPARLKTKLGLVLAKNVEQQQQIQQQQQRPMSQPSAGSSSRSHPTGDHSRSHSSHHRANHHHQKIPHAVQTGNEHVVPKLSSGQMKQPHAAAGVSASTSASNSCRPRPERSDRPINVPEPHFSAPQRTSGSTKGQLPPLTRGTIENMAQAAGSSMQSAPQQQQQQQQQQQRSNQPSHDPNYQQQHANKNRNINPIQQHQQPIQQNIQQRSTIKQDQRQHIKEQLQQQQQQPKPVDPTKNQLKQQTSGSSNMYPTNDSQQRMNVSSRQQPPYSQQLPNYNQAMANRNISQSQQQPDHNISVPSLKQSMAESSFRLSDELTNRNAEIPELNSPPKQQTIKAPSIFSPEWNDSSANVVPQKSNTNNGLNIKSNRDSPKKHRSETPKKEKRNDNMTTPVGNKISAHSEKRSNSAKRLTDTAGMPKIAVPPPISPFESTSTISKHLNTAVKRLLPDDMIKQENGIDFREAKHRKLDIQPLSPQHKLDTKINLSQLPMSVTPMYEPPMKSTFNGIETNPDLVSSLLKESLCSDTKFQSSLSAVPHDNMVPPSLIKSEPSKYESYEPSATLPQQLFETSTTLPTQIKLESGAEHEQRIKSEKKKKKEKHKHKDKEKGKDREERKKHKKDKDRQKDRERSNDLPTNDPIKITIPKEKLMSNQEPSTGGGIKITIPKDRFKSDAPVPQATSLKIKITKDVIENYSCGQQPGENNTNSHVHTGKKKDKERDRDREKSKSAKNFDFTKQNGNNGSNTNGGNGSATSSRNQSSNSNKMMPQYNNIQQQQQQQSQYMQHPQYMQTNNPYNNMASTLMFTGNTTGSNINQLPPVNRLPQQLQQQHQQQPQQQPMIDNNKYSNHYPPFTGNANYFYHGGNNSNISNNNINKKN